MGAYSGMWERKSEDRLRPSRQWLSASRQRAAIRCNPHRAETRKYQLSPRKRLQGTGKGAFSITFHPAKARRSPVSLQEKQRLCWADSCFLATSFGSKRHRIDGFVHSRSSTGSHNRAHSNRTQAAVAYNLRQMKTLAALALLWVSASFAQDYDILLRNGRLVDGAGNPSFLGDLAIRDGRIAAMGKLDGRTAKRVIDARGLVVAPGFIDMHNHSDYTLVADGDAQSMVRQGVTTMIFGEGGSAAPVGGKQQQKPRDIT